MTSFAVMAHPTRRVMAQELARALPDETTVAWDRVNNEWDTARRALLAYDPNATWHVVVQDDAVLCRDFAAGVEDALGGVESRHDGLVSFYTGQSRPYGKEVRRLVNKAGKQGAPWIAMEKGPYWGVCLAFPTEYIEGLIDFCDASLKVDYDNKLFDFFSERGVETWYSQPSLVNHRDSPESPSLIPGHGSSSGRVAHHWIGMGSPLSIDWERAEYRAGDPVVFWDRDFECSRCEHQSDDLPGAVVHAFEEHELGKVEFFATTQRHAKMLWDVRESLPRPIRGDLWVGGKEEAAKCTFPVRTVRRHSAVRQFSKPGPFILCGAQRDFRWTGGRAGWSIDGFSY